MSRPTPNCEPTLLVLTHAPDHASTAAGLAYAHEFCHNWQTKHPDGTAIELQVFCYSDAAMLANRLIWLPADLPNLVKDWQTLAKEFGLTFQVCVSTALARGVVDSDNAKRHGLNGDNVAPGFSLVGLGELAMHLHRYQQVLQF